MYSNGCIEISKRDGRGPRRVCARCRAHACGIDRSIKAIWRRPSATRLAASACRSYVNYAHGPRSCCRTRCNPSARCRVPLIAQATKPAAASKAGNEPAKNAKASNKTKQAEAAATGTAAEVCAHMQQSFSGPRGTLDALPCTPFADARATRQPGCSALMWRARRCACRVCARRRNLLSGAQA